MKNRVTQFRFFMCLWLVFFLLGFFICTTSTANVFIGITVIVIGSIFAVIGIWVLLRHYQIQNKEKEDRKEDRIKKLEEEVEQLKQNNLR